MSHFQTLNLSLEEARELSMVDLAYLILKNANTPFYYRDLMAEVARIKGFTEEEAMKVIAQLYTEINVDGRFACVGNNLWGLKRWYPVDTKDGEIGSAKPRIINDDDDDDLDEEEYTEEDEGFNLDEEDFDAYGEEPDEVDPEDEDALFGDEEDEDPVEDLEFEDMEEPDELFDSLDDDDASAELDEEEDK